MRIVYKNKKRIVKRIPDLFNILDKNNNSSINKNEFMEITHILDTIRIF